MTTTFPDIADVTRRELIALFAASGLLVGSYWSDTVTARGTARQRPPPPAVS